MLFPTELRDHTKGIFPPVFLPVNPLEYYGSMPGDAPLGSVDPREVHTGIRQSTGAS